MTARELAQRARERALWLRARWPGYRRPLLAGAAVLAVVLVTAGVALFASLPGREALRTLGDMSQATTLYDVHNRPVFTIFKEYRIEVPLARMSPDLRRAILAIEDQRFTRHRGIDVVRIAAAAWTDLREGRPAQGGSTITQQLARQVFLDRKKTLARKVKEAALALRIEEMYTKDEILELYLNKVYFGDGLHGAEAAARGYFGKSAGDLTLSEAALLAGLVNAPSVNAPTVSLSRAVSRRNVVLQAMYQQGDITRPEFERASREKVELRDNLRREEPIGQYFKEEVRQQLVKQFGWERISEGGLRVYTTIDPAFQRAAEAAVAAGIARVEDRRAARARARKTVEQPGGPLQAALIAIDPASGEVRAMVGGRDFAASRFNRAMQAHRQPGSAFKPFVYAAALEAGYSPASLVTDLNEPVPTLQGAWIPEDEHAEGDSMTIRTALRTSSNRAAVRMLEDVGISSAVDYARRLGIGSVPSVPSLALGSGEVTLAAMTSAYGAFASAGIVRPATLIRRIEDSDGKLLFETKPQAQQVLSPATAYLMSSMLADVVNRGTAYKARLEGFTLPAAGKTGTTNDFNDAWFVGFTPQLVAGVWMGFDQPRTILPNGFAGDLAVPMWADFMKDATRGAKPEWLSPPAGLVPVSVCAVSGQLPGAACDRVITEYFVRGTVPTEQCSIHTLPAEAPLLAVLDGSPASRAVSVSPVRPPQPPAASAESTPVKVAAEASPPPEPPEKKKRGFWGRLFGK